MGLFKSQESVVACSNNYYANFSRYIDNIWTEQRIIAIHLCTFLSNAFIF